MKAAEERAELNSKGFNQIADKLDETKANLEDIEKSFLELQSTSKKREDALKRRIITLVKELDRVKSAKFLCGPKKGLRVEITPMDLQDEVVFGTSDSDETQEESDSDASMVWEMPKK